MSAALLATEGGAPNLSLVWLLDDLSGKRDKLSGSLAGVGL